MDDAKSYIVDWEEAKTPTEWHEDEYRYWRLTEDN
jgi:hypothetical protein